MLKLFDVEDATAAKDIYIFDLDGTIANIEHRRHLLDSNDKNKFKIFEDECINDLPNTPVIKILNVLLATDAKILIFSGRSERVKLQTIEWLIANTALTQELLEQDGMLTMRPIDNYIEDDQLKNMWLKNMIQEDRENIIAVFDDRQTVVDMWRNNNITCFQVAPGNF